MPLRIQRTLAVAATVVCTLLSAPLLAAQTTTKTFVAPRITEKIVENHLAALRGNVHPLAQARYDNGPAPASMSIGQMHLVLKRSAAQQQALTEYLSAVQNPSSPGYRKWLTPAQFGAAYGPAEEDVQIVKAWLESKGFQVNKIPQARNVIPFTGTAAQVQNAFHTSIHSFTVNGETHFANISEPQIPAALSPVVNGVGPLHDFKPRSMARIGQPARFNAATGAFQPEYTRNKNGTLNLYMDPADAATIYDTPNPALNPNYSGPTYDGAGVSIGIIGDSNINLEDPENYRLTFLGETAANANVPIIVLDGNDPGVNGDSGEALMDVEIAGGLAPKARVYLYVGAAGIFAAMARALDDNIVSILSISFDGCEKNMGNSGNAEILALMEQAAAQGISVTVAAGDDGPANCESGDDATASSGFAVNGLASTPWNIAVGGTDFAVLPANFSMYVDDSGIGSAPYYRTAKSYIPEVPWNDSTAINTTLADNILYTDINGASTITAGSGGPSSCAVQTNGTCQGYPKPAFQTSLTPNDGVRDLPDVSFLASDGFSQAKWAVCGDGGSGSSHYYDCLTTNGQLNSDSIAEAGWGTSASTPAFAGMLALVSQAQGARLGQPGPILYQLAQSHYAAVYHDVVTGNNSVDCFAGTPDCGSNGFMTGYDAVPGYDLASGLGSVDVAAMIANWNSASLASTSTTLSINGSTAQVTAVHGTALTLDVSVTPASATGVIGIIDTATEDTNEQIAIPLTNGNGSMTYSGLPGGSYTVYARYSGDTTNAASTSTPINVTISPEDTRLTASTSNSSISTTDSTTIGVVLSTQSAGNFPTGSITLSLNGKVLSSATSFTQTSGAMKTYESLISLQASQLPAGPNVITVTYSGDNNYSGSSTTITVTAVVAVAPSMMVTPNASNITMAQPLNVAIVVSGNMVSPTGTVTLTSGSYTSQATMLSSGATTISIPAGSLSTGTDTLTVTYTPDSASAPYYNAASGTAIITVAVPVSPGLTLSNSGNITLTRTPASGTSVITVTPTGGFTGLVNLSCSITTNMVSAVDSPTCSMDPAVTISTATAQTATLSITTTSNSSDAIRPSHRGFVLAGAATMLPMMFLCGIRARRKGWISLVSLLVLIVCFAGQGCGGGSYSEVTGTTPGVYSVTVTGTDASTRKLTSNTVLTLTVNH